eukprot:s905_g3.t1
MRKYGLSKEQRSQVIRAAGGSSRFLDVERIMRASDIEDNNRSDNRHGRPPQKMQRRDSYAVQDDDNSSLEPPLSSSDDEEALLGEGKTESNDDDESDDGLAEIYELQKRAKKEFKKSFKTYKESKKRVKEIKKTRAGAPYFPVVAMPPEQAAASGSSQMPAQKSFKYDKKDVQRKKGDAKSVKSGQPRREDANLATTTAVLTEFNYMVESNGGAEIEEIYGTSIPEGHAIIDTGCTTSVVGEETAETYSEFFKRSGFPAPQPVELPPVELKGFNGRKEITSKGLQWTVKLGSLYGNVTTYVVPGATPFLLSRRVLEGMEASIDMGKMTISSHKHGLQNEPVKQASNGHMLLPLCQIFEVDENADQENNEPNNSENGPLHADMPADVPTQFAQDRSRVKLVTPGDRKRAFQHIVKNTKKGKVDVSLMRDKLVTVFGKRGNDITYGETAYKPKKERVPSDAGQQPYYVSVATLSQDGQLDVTPWKLRVQNSERKPVQPMPVAVFVHIPLDAHDDDADVETPTSQDPEHVCVCCNQLEPDEPDKHHALDAEALYGEDHNWVDAISKETIPQDSQDHLLKGIRALRRVGSRLVVSRIQSDPKGVKRDLQAWLGDQAFKLDASVGLIEVFTGKANLSKQYEKKTGLHAIRLGLQYGQDFTRLQDHFVQVELHREDERGEQYEVKRNVLTCVDLATDFCQQVIVEPGPNSLAKAFHKAWGRPYGVPKTIYMDPDHKFMSTGFQQYLVHNNVELLLCAAESHWQLGSVEIANRILRNMARRAWKTSPRPPEEVIEACASIRNDQLRKAGHSPSQWFLGREPRQAGALENIEEQYNPVSQSHVLSDPSFAARMALREQAAKAFIEEHSRDVWRRAIAGRNRLMRGPFVQGQLVYMFRSQGKGQLLTRHGKWLGPGRIIGTESSSGSVIPRLIWVSYNGYLYRCSPEGLRPLAEDESTFRELSKDLSAGSLHDDLERAEDKLAERAGQFVDLLPDKPVEDEDLELQEDVDEEPEYVNPHPEVEGSPKDKT